MGRAPDRLPRVAFLLLRGLDHFTHDLVPALAANGAVEACGFHLGSQPERDLGAALAWADDPARDAIWFEFCWPPFPELIARTDFGGRRVIVRVHRIEAYETPHAARTPWHKVDDAIVVSGDMGRILRDVAGRNVDPCRTRLHVVHNGVDIERFAPAPDGVLDPFRIGWCGSMILRKNPTLALEILSRLRAEDPRYRLHLTFGWGDRIAMDSFARLVARMHLSDAVQLDGAIPAARMPEWHARNGVLLSTSLHESFGYAIAEAAAVGCDIAVLDHLGAEEFWPAATRFGTVDEAVRLIRHAGRHRWRAHVAEHFSLARQVAAVLAVLNGASRTSVQTVTVGIDTCAMGDEYA